MLLKIRKFTAAAVLVATPLLSLMAPAIAHAASTVTWTGGGTDGKWSTTANWAGGIAPVNGDSVVIDNSASFAHGSTDDAALPLTNLATVTFTNNAASNLVSISLGQNLTINSAITQAASVTTTTDVIDNDATVRTLILGGDVTVTSTAGISIGNTGDTLALGTHTLTLTDAGGTTSHIVAISSNITGTGGIVFNGAQTDYQLQGNNTYSGPTHVIATNLPIDNTGTNNNIFGTSAITVESGGSATFNFSTNTTISNPIVVNGTVNGSPVTSLNFNDGGQSSTVITVPSITLHGSTRFANDGTGTTPLVVNLAGITANGSCIEYLGYGHDTTNGPANGFTNGAPGCVLAATTNTSNTAVAAPKAPNTGFALAAAHPAITLAITALSAAAIYSVARMTRKTVTSHR